MSRRPMEKIHQPKAVQTAAAWEKVSQTDPGQTTTHRAPQREAYPEGGERPRKTTLIQRKPSHQAEVQWRRGVRIRRRAQAGQCSRIFKRSVERVVRRRCRQIHILNGMRAGIGLAMHPPPPMRATELSRRTAREVEAGRGSLVLGLFPLRKR